jgi:hypothetical protein
MPFSLTCPNPSCSAKLKTPNAIPFGRTVQCPKCKNPFTVDATNLQELPADAATVTAGTRPPSTTNKAAPSNERPTPKAEVKKRPADEDEEEAPPRRRGRDEEEEETPRARRRGGDDEENGTPRSRRKSAEEDEEAPRSRRSRDEENEAPRSRRKSEDEEEAPRSRRGKSDDEDEAPRSRKRGRDEEDEDDDKPRSRRRGKDDEENDDSPKSRRRGKDDDEDESPRTRRRGRDEDEDESPRRKGKKSKGNTGKMILLVGGGLLLLAGLIVGAIFLFSGGSYDKKMLAFMPSDTTVIVGLNVSEALDNEQVKALVDLGMNNIKGPNPLKQAGLELKDINKIYVGAGKLDFKGGAEPSGVVVVRFNNAPDKKKIADTMKAKEEKYKDKPFYKGTDMWMFFPDDDLAVGCSSEDLLKKLMDKDGSEITISEDLKTLVDKASSGTAWVAAAVDINSLTKNLPPQAQMLPMMMGGLGSEVGDAVKTSKGIAAWAKISSSSLSAGVTLMCKDDDTASKAAVAANKQLEPIKKLAGAMPGGNEKAQAAKDVLDSIDISSSGKMFNATLKVNTKSFGGAGGFGKGFPF